MNGATYSTSKSCEATSVRNRIAGPKAIIFLNLTTLKKCWFTTGILSTNMNDCTLKTDDAFYLKTNIRTMHQNGIGAQSLHG